MKNIIMERITPPTNEVELLNIEKEMECQFPNDYRQFLLTYNGGIPKKNIIPFVENGIVTEDYVDLFCGICDNRTYSLFTIYCRFIGRIPDNTIPIARDPGGNLFVMSIRGDDYGCIYFWDHEEECSDNWDLDDTENTEYKSPDYSNMTFVAKSFTDLINNLRGISELDDK